MSHQIRLTIWMKKSDVVTKSEQIQSLVAIRRQNKIERSIRNKEQNLLTFHEIYPNL